MKLPFGAKCKYKLIQGQMFDPDICYCSHPDNKQDVEGNCSQKLCPLGLIEEDKDA